MDPEEWELSTSGDWGLPVLLRTLSSSRPPFGGRGKRSDASCGHLEQPFKSF